MTYIDLRTGEEIEATDPRVLKTREERIAAANAEWAAFESAQQKARMRECVCAQCRHS